jgi:hypothetical protein
MNRGTQLLLAGISGFVASMVALVLVLSVSDTSATPMLQSGAPGQVSYQGYLSPPLTSTVTMEFAIYETSTAGSPIWQETQNNVEVGNGFFSVLLGSLTPLDASVFSGTSRYLEVRVDTGSGLNTLPRQPFATVPYAFQAAQAAEAAAVDWSNIDNVPAGFADGVDDEGTGGGLYENVIVVAKNGTGDYESVSQALAQTSDASQTNRFLVWVAPGVYTDTNLLQVREYVHLKGAGPNAAVLVSNRSNNAPNNDAATVQLDDGALMSDISVRNIGTGTISIAVYSAETTRDTVIDNVMAEASGAGGVGRYAAYLNDAQPTIQHSTLKASGAMGSGSAVNAAVGIVNIASGFPQPLIKNSTLLGGAASTSINCNDPTGTGFGIQGTNASPEVVDSYVCGGHRGISIGVNGNALVSGSKLATSSATDAFLLETTSSASISIDTSGLFSQEAKRSALGSSLKCVHTHDSSYNEVSSTCVSAIN